MFQMDPNDVAIPNPVYMKWPQNYSCVDSPTPVLQQRYEGLFRKQQQHTNAAQITITNPASFTVPPCCYKTIDFKVLVTTSLPAVTLIYGSEFLFRLGLTCVINHIPTNEIFLYVTVYNNKSTSIAVDENSLQFTAHTVLAKYP